MRFMIIRKADPETEAGTLPGEQLIADMAEYNEALLRAGVLRDGMGLRSSAEGARVTFSGGRPSVVDGPFTEAKELVAGFTLIDVGSREEAIAWAKRWPRSDGHGNVSLEIRRVFELDELGAGEGIERHRAIQDTLAN
jgi:hypothetical protein